MKNSTLIFALFAFAASGFQPLFADEAAEPVKKPVKSTVLNTVLSARKYFGFSLLESGSWEYEGTMSNRANAVLFAPAGFSLRVQALDKRPAPPQDNWQEGTTGWNYGLYQQETGSRVLYGQLESSGLATRTRNIWAHGAPYVETHKRTSVDLKSSPQSNRKDAFFGALGSPVVKILDGTARIPLNFAVKSDASIFIDEKKDLLYQLGGDFYWGLRKKANNKLRFEWIMTETTLKARKQSTWFAEKPYLPGRKLRFNAFNATFSHPYLGLSSDVAYSEVFAWGEDIYVNGAVRIGAAPWRFSFSGDGAGEKYVGGDGGASGAGFRVAGKFEWFSPGGGTGASAILFGTGAECAVQTTLRSAGLDEPFVVSSSKISYQFPVIKRFLITPSRLSLAFDRDATNPYHIEEKTAFLAGIKIGPARTSLRLTLAEWTASAPGKPIELYPNLQDEKQKEYVQTDFEISVPVYFVTLKGTLSSKTEKDKEAVLGGSFSASIQGKLGRLSLKISSKNKDAPLEYYLSWRIEKKW
jgi:hypothetical protein